MKRITKPSTLKPALLFVLEASSSVPAFYTYVKHALLSVKLVKIHQNTVSSLMVATEAFTFIMIRIAVSPVALMDIMQIYTLGFANSAPQAV